MQLNISKEYFYELLGIVGIKAHIEKISNLEINGSSAFGEIEVNLSYSDSLGMECFKVLTFPFELELDEIFKDLFKTLFKRRNNIFDEIINECKNYLEMNNDENEIKI